MGAERHHGSWRSLWSGYLMPVPEPLALGEAPSGGGKARTAGRALQPGAESRGGWEELLPEPSTGPGRALSQVRHLEGCGPRGGEGASLPSPTEAHGPGADIAPLHPFPGTPDPDGAF